MFQLTKKIVMFLISGTILLIGPVFAGIQDSNRSLGTGTNKIFLAPTSNIIRQLKPDITQTYWAANPRFGLANNGCYGDFPWDNAASSTVGINHANVYGAGYNMGKGIGSNPYKPTSAPAGINRKIIVPAAGSYNIGAIAFICSSGSGHYSFYITVRRFGPSGAFIEDLVQGSKALPDGQTIMLSIWTPYAVSLNRGDQIDYIVQENAGTPTAWAFMRGSITLDPTW